MLPGLDALIDRALAEDVGDGDITTAAVYHGTETAHADIVAKEAGVVAGLEVAARIYRRTDAGIRFEAAAADGMRVEKGTTVASVRGAAHHLLTTERTVLNFMQRMSGVATRTRTFVDLVAHTEAAILDTRKTIPGHRELDKWAVRLGGGRNHRAGLYDMYLIKENHIAVAGGIVAALDACVAHRKRTGSGAPIELEVPDLESLAEALAHGAADIIMLDNFGLAQMREAVARTAGRVPLEASGNVNLTTVVPIAETGVDRISVGSLTHSVQALDLSMLFR